MKSTKPIIGIVFFIAFILGSGFILVEFGNKSNDNPSPDQSQPVAADVPIDPTPSVPAPLETPVTTATTTAPATKETVGSVTPPPAIKKTAPVSVPAKPSSPYADGTYSAKGSYDSPAGTESITVSVTLKDGIIESSTITNEADNRTSSRYQNMFISGYKTYVTGRNIASVSLGRVSGSSLTGSGFNAALAKIKKEATA